MTTSQIDGSNNFNRNDTKSIVEKKEQLRQQQILINNADSAPILNELAQIGLSVDWVGSLYTRKLNYKDAIPILLKWLPIIENLDVKEDIVRALTVRWAKPVASKPLIEEFYKLQGESNSGIKWAIGNALAEVADDSVYQDLVNIALDSGNGTARQMIIIALGKMKNPDVENILISLLGDDQVCGQAIISLGKIGSKKAVSSIEKYLNHPKTWIRNEAKKAISRIENKIILDGN
jgi:HEAT repeat protein